MTAKDIAKMKDFQRYRTIGRVYQDPAWVPVPNLTMLENMSLADNKGKPFGLSRGVNTPGGKAIRNSFPFWGWVWKIK